MSSRTLETLSARRNLARPIALVTAFTLVFMTVYELVTTLLFPSITLWESHLITIVVSGTIATVTAFFALRRYERLRQSEESYRPLVEQSPDAIWVHRRGKIVFANSACAAMFGASSVDELIGKHILDLVHPDDRAAVHERLERREGDLSAPPLRTETRYPGFDGREFHVESMVKPVLYQGEASTQVIFRDISERKKSEQQLRQSEERFYKAFNASPEPITIATASEGLYVDVNESFLRLTGHRHEEVIGRTSLELKFWERPEDRAKLVDILKEHGRVRDLEITFLTKSGQQRTGLDSAEVIEVDGQECIIAFFKDITEQRLLEKQFRQAQKMEAIGQLSGGIAHDFNNLLGVILGYSGLLEDHASNDPAVRKKAGEITKAARRAADLTRQLLAFSRQQVLEPKVVNLNAVV